MKERLENKLQAQLQSAGQVCRAGSKYWKALTAAAGIPRRIVGSPIARDLSGIGLGTVRIVGGRPSVAAQVGKFRVVKDVKCLRAEFEVFALGHLEMLNQSHIEVLPPWISEDISARVSES